MPLSRREAATLLLKAKRAEETFEHFIKYMQPDWDIPRFQLKLIECLHLLEQGELFPEFWDAFKKRRYASARKSKRPQRGDRAQLRVSRREVSPDRPKPELVRLGRPHS